MKGLNIPGCILGRQRNNYKTLLLSCCIFLSCCVLLAGCASSMRKAPHMSLDEAKKVTVSMSEKPFVPPPRSIHDILDLLDEPGRFDPQITRMHEDRATDTDN